MSHRLNKSVTLLSVLICLAACAGTHVAAIPLGNDMMEIDASATQHLGRAGAEQAALQKAAEATVQAGYDKFIVVSNDGWNEVTAGGGHVATYNATLNQNGGTATGASGGGWSTRRNPEAKMVIHMYHNGDKEAEKAVDAHALLAQPQ